MITASYLFAPEMHNPGDEKCFYCGMNCDKKYTKKEYVKKTFTNRDIVHYPGSGFVCGCCVASMTVITTTTMVDGEVKTGRSGAVPSYSWLLTKDGNYSFSKRHLDFARSVILSPPEPPFSLVITDSGKKQLVFRAPVNMDRKRLCIQFEEEQVEIELDRFESVLDCASKTCLAIGKKSLLNPNNFSCFLSTEKLYGSVEQLEKWILIHNEPIAKIAAWVCKAKGKKDESDQYSINNAVQTTFSGRDRPRESKAKQRAAGNNETDGNQFRLNFA